MQVLLVEKENTFSASHVERFIAFDPRTRQVYLSDAGARRLQWKKGMRLYAVRLNYVYTDLDLRHKDTDVRDVLAFTVYGANERRLGKAENEAGLPDLRQCPAAQATQAVSWGSYVEGEARQSCTTTSVITTTATATSSNSKSGGDGSGGDERAREDAAFLASGGCTWHLRCTSYGGCHDMIMLMRDVLIADGLRAPVHGGLPGLVDPRNGLHFAAIPLYLQRDFHCLLDATVYSCVHGEIVGCSVSGQLGIALKHVYLCITELQVLFLSEEGKAVRWLPLCDMECVEYYIAPDDPAIDATHTTSNHHSSGGGGSGSSSFVAFVMRGDAPDVLFRPTDAFAAGTASASLVAAMPRSLPSHELTRLLSILQQLMKRSLRAAALPVASASQSASCESRASMTLQEYVSGFAARHARRALRWQPLPGYGNSHATVPSAGALAERLCVTQPTRQPITYHANFELFYFAIPSVTLLRRVHSPAQGSASRCEESCDTHRASASPPRSKLIRIVQSLNVDPNMY